MGTGLRFSSGLDDRGDSLMASPATYRIEVRGILETRWWDCFSGMDIRVEACEDGTIGTVLTGRLPDQAAVSGVLFTLFELRHPVTQVRMLHGDQPE